MYLIVVNRLGRPLAKNTNKANMVPDKPLISFFMDPVSADAEQNVYFAVD